ncbi:MAG: SDR family NAD(P)-dependent oxidoreductase [Clostridia bacterium]|nr:SDR family NAD(P)-dependent oxidoreductase [Clostridia bacterium]
MNTANWLKHNTTTLAGKTVAVTGSTGGLGQALCHHLAGLGAALLLLDRNSERSQALGKALTEQYGVSVRCLRVDLADMASVYAVTDELLLTPPDIFIHNAGAYSIPKELCSTGYGNVFQINFVSPYYIIRTLLPALRAIGGRVVVVGSIAHNYSKTDPNDIDFSTRRAASKVYGNAKRYLMFSLYRLFAKEDAVRLSVTHPGISFTGITAHYPKVIFALIKHPMKVTFMKPPRACLSILRGVYDQTRENEWIGPRIFNVWGLPKKMKLRTVSPVEADAIEKTAQDIYTTLSRKA